MILRWLGVIDIFVIWLGGAYVMTHWPAKLKLTFSQNVASERKRFLTWASIMSITLPLFLIFMLAWFIPTFDLPWLLAGIITTAVLAELGAAWTRDRETNMHLGHNIMAYGVAFLLPIFLLLCYVHYNINKQIRFIFLVVSVLEIGLVISYLIFVKFVKKYYLVFQSSYIVSFHIALVLAAILK